jgi:acetyl esterase/lipase
MMDAIVRFFVRLALAQKNEALVRSSGGAPRTVAGRVLDPRFQFLEHKARRRPAEAPTPDSTRAQTRELVNACGGRREPGVAVSAIDIPLAGRSVPARLYRGGNGPLFVFYHFGGGVVGDLDTCDAFCSILARATNGPVVSVAYRLAPEHPWPAGLEDAIESFLWARENAEKLGARSQSIGVGGDSMGGNFAAILCQELMRRGLPQPAVQLLIYPATDLADASPSMSLFADAFPLTKPTMDWFMSQYLPLGADLADPRLSPIRGKLAGLAPALIYTAGFDPLADQGRLYAEAIVAAGGSALHRLYASLAHGFTAFTGVVPAADAACREIAAETAEILKRG